MGGAIETLGGPQDIRGRARNTIRTVLLLVRPLIIAAYFLSSSSNGIYKLFLNYTQKEITQLKCLFSRTVNDEKGNRFLKREKNNNRLLNVVICQLMHAFETTSKLLNMRMWEWREFFFFCFHSDEKMSPDANFLIFFFIVQVLASPVKVPSSNRWSKYILIVKYIVNKACCMQIIITKGSIGITFRSSEGFAIIENSMADVSASFILFHHFEMFFFLFFFERGGGIEV